ncbi:hypothetical protein [Pseudomonas sp. NPDC086251]|uniref:hypothetical protein n=1 Tax=Pseudomonas sp. NPDC086251 TaxID=3364431 RepID=UPI003832BACA
MSIRCHNKDHLLKNAGSGAESLVIKSPPETHNPLQFWVEHPAQNTLVDLTILAEGQTKGVDCSGRWKGDFSGRPQLIRQMEPAIKASLLGLSAATVRNRMHALRTWWRLLDHVEKAAEQEGESRFKVEDVRQLTRVHSIYACQNRMDSCVFNFFVCTANATLTELGLPKLYWDSPESPKISRNLPPQADTDVLRMALKYAWQKVRKKRELMDRVREANFIPKTAEESDFLKHWLYFNNIQISCNSVLPASEQIRGKMTFRKFKDSTNLALCTLRETLFPNMWETHTAFHMCLASTGWNVSVLATLDASIEESFLRNHPQDESRYTLVGTKARAGGKEQYVNGLWKTLWGPGPIIRAWLKWVVPIRKLLQAELLIAQELYKIMCQSGASHGELARQHVEVQRLDRGCRSIWLFVGGTGQIGWVDSKCERHYLNGNSVTYLEYLTFEVNEERIVRGEAPLAVVKSSDFRDIFAMYIWRQSGSNILAVMRLLNHARLRTTQRYVDNNILNAERDQKVRTFLDDLFSELGQGRLDITILAHRQQFGSVTPEMEKRLDDYRTLERSRLRFGCKNPYNPPAAIQPDTDGSKRCGQQRLLCNAGVILPESLEGVAMRVEELRVIQRSVSIEAWLTSDFSQELINGLNVLKLFPLHDVLTAVERWTLAIASGAHRVPGLRFDINRVEVI